MKNGEEILRKFLVLVDQSFTLAHIYIRVYGMITKIPFC